MKKYSVKSGGQILLIPISRIILSPYRIRKLFSKETLDSLCKSIANNGLITPLAVSAAENGDYIIISGERRFIAAQMAGLNVLPCVLYSVKEDISLISLTENLQTEKLNCFEEAEAFADLYYNRDMSLHDIAEKTAISESEILFRLRLLNIPDDIKKSATENNFSNYELLKIVRAVHKGNVKAVHDAILAEHRQLREFAEEEDKNSKDNQSANEPLTLFKDTKIFENTIDHAVNTMLKSGFKALSSKEETSDFIEYTVRIQKTHR